MWQCLFGCACWKGDENFPLWLTLGKTACAGAARPLVVFSWCVSLMPSLFDPFWSGLESMSCLDGGKTFGVPQCSYSWRLLSGQIILTLNHNTLVIGHMCKMGCWETRWHTVSLAIEELKFYLILLTWAAKLSNLASLKVSLGVNLVSCKCCRAGLERNVVSEE